MYVIILSVAVFGLDVRDWNDRPLGAATAVVFDSQGRAVALTYVVDGAALYRLPWAHGFVLRVAWGHATLGEIAQGRVIWIYDSSVWRDVAELGLPTGGKIRTWVYPMAVVIRTKGPPPAGCVARVVDVYTGGRWVYQLQPVHSDGAVSLVQAPATDYKVDIYCGGYLVATGRFSIQRGTPATAWNFEMTIEFIDAIRVYNAP